MKNDKIRKIVNAQIHKGVYKIYKDGKVTRKQVFWTNTNKLLGESGVTGIKTGITSKAGGCLSTSFKKKNGE